MPEVENGHVLSLEEILAADDIEEKWIDVPEWGGRVKVRALNLAQIARIAQKSIRTTSNGQSETSREVSVLMTLQEGMVEPKLTPDKAKAMSQKSAAAVTRIVQAINALGVTEEAVDEADKSPWDESDAPVSIRAGAGVGHDVAATRNGDAYQ